MKGRLAAGVLFIMAIVGLVFVAAQGEQPAPPTITVCAYLPFVTMHGPRSPCDNHPHAPDTEGTNYEKLDCSAVELVPVVRPQYCVSTCPTGQAQRPFPDCSCIRPTPTPTTCTNTCAPGESRTAYPECRCYTPVVETPVPVCTNTCPTGKTRTAYPECACITPPPPTCATKCAAGEMQMPYPDCRCRITEPTPACAYIPGVTGFGTNAPGRDHPAAPDTSETGYEGACPAPTP